MSTIKPNVNVSWSNAGTNTDPGTGKYNVGWLVGDIPPAEYFNYILNRIDTFEKHITQFGVAQWDAITDYPIHGVVMISNGVLYQSLQTPNVNKPPATNPTFWAELISQEEVAGETGSLVFFARDYTAQIPGYLLANGAAVSRIDPKTKPLFDVIGTKYGAGNGTTTYNLPDTRGYFLRATSAGSSIDSGRIYGTPQLQAIQSHAHSIVVRGGGGGTVGSGGSSGTAVASTEATGGSETRPINHSASVFIKL